MDNNELPRGALVPVEGGWLLRDVLGAAGDVQAGSGGAAPLLLGVPLIGGILAAVAVVGLTHVYNIWILLAAGLATSAGLRAMLRPLAARLAGHAMGKHRLLEDAAAAPAGGPVRLRGTVESNATFSSPVSGLPAVLCRWQAHRTAVNDASGWLIGDGLATAAAGATLSGDITRGIDFHVRLDVGQVVRVSVRHAILVNLPVGRHTRLAGPGGEWVASLGGSGTHFRECGVAPGDRVEIVGHFRRDVVPDGEPDAPGGRGVLLVNTIAGLPDQPMLVRNLNGEPGSPARLGPGDRNGVRLLTRV